MVKSILDHHLPLVSGQIKLSVAEPFCHILHG
jgi:hypothetical protein